MAMCDAFPGGIYQVDVLGKWDGQQDVINSFQLLYTTGGTISAATLWNDMGNWVDDLYTIVKGICNVLMVIEKYRVTELDGTCSSGPLNLSPTIAGTLTNDAYASGVAALTQYKTGVKRVNLRKYWGGLDESVVNTGGGISGGALTTLASVNAFLLAPYTTGTQTYQYGYKSPKTGSFLTPISASSAAWPAYQRRRRVGTGS